jgi:hypothetical protein
MIKHRSRRCRDDKSIYDRGIKLMHDASYFLSGNHVEKHQQVKHPFHNKNIKTFNTYDYTTGTATSR